jgi:hypothetical protein
MRLFYNHIRRSIRDNGWRYTYAHAMDTDDIDTLFICEELMNITKQTDWLAMRRDFAKHGRPDIAFKLTMKVKP